jgi:hypothetical protein
MSYLPWSSLCTVGLAEKPLLFSKAKSGVTEEGRSLRNAITGEARRGCSWLRLVPVMVMKGSLRCVVMAAGRRFVWSSCPWVLLRFAGESLRCDVADAGRRTCSSHVLDARDRSFMADAGRRFADDDVAVAVLMSRDVTLASRCVQGKPCVCVCICVYLCICILMQVVATFTCVCGVCVCLCVYVCAGRYVNIPICTIPHTQAHTHTYTHTHTHTHIHTCMYTRALP